MKASFTDSRCRYQACPAARALSRALVAIGVLSFGAACTERGDEPAPETASPAAEAAPDPGSNVENTPEDAAIFRTTVEWAREQRIDTLPIGEAVARIGTRFVGAPYVPKTLDPPGAERLIVNLRTFDCVTFVESMLALARVVRSGDAEFDDFTRELRTIRYRTGSGDSYVDRLHYFSEWVGRNAERGIVRDITASLGGEPDTTRVDFMSAHPELYRQLAEGSTLDAIRAVESELAARPREWLPESRIADAAPRIRDGDIIAATSTVPGLDVAHTGIALWVDGRLHLMHAPLVGSHVEISELPLSDRILRLEAQDGIMVARPL